MIYQPSLGLNQHCQSAYPGVLGTGVHGLDFFSLLVYLLPTYTLVQANVDFSALRLFSLSSLSVLLAAYEIPLGVSLLEPFRFPCVI